MKYRVWASYTQPDSLLTETNDLLGEALTKEAILAAVTDEFAAENIEWRGPTAFTATMTVLDTGRQQWRLGLIPEEEL